MAAMIQNDQDKEWLLPLLDLRNELDQPDDRHLRDFRRITGSVQLFHDGPIHGPYKQSVREHWLRRVLEVQKWVREHGPEDVRNLELITLEEMKEIRRLWVVEKHEFEDNLPRIYHEAMGDRFSGPPLDENLSFGAEEISILREVCGTDELLFELTRELLDVERRYRTASRRAGLFDAIDKAFRRSFYENEHDALDRARRHKDGLTVAIEETVGLGASEAADAALRHRRDVDKTKGQRRKRHLPVVQEP